MVGQLIEPFQPRPSADLALAAVLAVADADIRDVIRNDLSVALGWAGSTDEGEQLAAAVVAETVDVAVRGRAASWLASSLLVRGKAQEARACATGR